MPSNISYLRAPLSDFRMADPAFFKFEGIDIDEAIVSVTFPELLKVKDWQG